MNEWMNEWIDGDGEAFKNTKEERKETRKKEWRLTEQQHKLAHLFQSEPSLEEALDALLLALTAGLALRLRLARGRALLLVERGQLDIVERQVEEHRLARHRLVVQRHVDHIGRRLQQAAVLEPHVHALA